MIYDINLRLLISSPLIITIIKLLDLNININYLYLLILLTIILFQGKKKNLLMLFFVFSIIMIQIIFMRENISLTSLVYFINFILTLYFIRSMEIYGLENIYQENKLLIKNIIIITTVINIVMFFNKSGWDFIWDARQFQSVYGFPHDACYLFLVMQSYSIIAYLNEDNNIKKYIFKSFIFLYFLFSCFTNARTPFFIAAFLILLFVYKTTKNKSIIVVMYSFVFLLIIISNFAYNFIDYSKIPILSKFIRGEETGNMTSSRDAIWNSILTGYKNFNFLEKLFGSGFGVSFKINQILFGKALWSHNDIYEVLVSSGIVGLLIYLYNLIKTLKMTKSILFIVVVFSVLFFNGLYTYYSFVLGFPFIILSVNKLVEYNRS